MSSNKDWTDIDLEDLPADALPVTSYKPAGDRDVYDASYTHWDIQGESIPARDHYRMTWRAMAANTGERTLISALVPAATAHVDGLHSLWLPSRIDLLSVIGATTSLIADFSVRSAPKSTIRSGVINRIPSAPRGHLTARLILRVLRLNCLTTGYADLWRDVWQELAPADPSTPHPFTQDGWTGGVDYPNRPALSDVGPDWTPDTPLRRETDRRQALLEIDVLVALSLGITADELCTIYRTQFPVLYGYDHGKYVYDANGRLVPNTVQTVWRKKGDATSREERTATHPGSGINYVYELPFTRLDREADFRRAFEVFSKLENSEHSLGVN